MLFSRCYQSYRVLDRYVKEGLQGLQILLERNALVGSRIKRYRGRRRDVFKRHLQPVLFTILCVETRFPGGIS